MLDRASAKQRQKEEEIERKLQEEKEATRGSRDSWRKTADLRKTDNDSWRKGTEKTEDNSNPPAAKPGIWLSGMLRKLQYILQQSFINNTTISSNP